MADASGPRLLSLPHRHAAIPLQRTRPRGISLLRNTHKSTSLLKGSEIGKRALQRTSTPSPPFLRLLSLSLESILSVRAYVRPRLHPARMDLLGSWYSREKRVYERESTHQILSATLSTISNARDTSVSCGIREGKLSASMDPCFFFFF